MVVLDLIEKNRDRIEEVEIKRPTIQIEDKTAVSGWRCEPEGYIILKIKLMDGEMR
jgi:hypothetical protein